MTTVVDFPTVEGDRVENLRLLEGIYEKARNAYTAGAHRGRMHGDPLPASEVKALKAARHEAMTRYHDAFKAALDHLDADRADPSADPVAIELTVGALESLYGAAGYRDRLRPPDPATTAAYLARTPSSWCAADLSALDDEPEEPTILARADGVRLIYPGRLHWCSGEPEAGKSWLTMLAVHEVLVSGGRVLVVDLEDDAVGFVRRCAAIGLKVDAYPKQLRYVSPAEPVISTTDQFGPAQLAFDEHIRWAPTLVVIDACTAGMALEGFDPLSNRDTATWIAAVAKPFTRAGSAVMVLDHVTKSKEGRDRWAIGSQHKLAAVDGAAFKLQTVRPVGRARGTHPVEGVSQLTVVKDRRGYLRGHTSSEQTAVIADLSMTAYPDGGLTIRLEVPGRGAIDDHQRKVIAHLAVYDGATMTALRDLGNSDSMTAAIKALIASGEIEIEQVGRSHRHHLTAAGRDRWADTIDAATGGES